MQGNFGLALIGLMLAAVAWSYGPRPLPHLPESRLRIETQLVNDAQPAGKGWLAVGDAGLAFRSADRGMHWDVVTTPVHATLTRLRAASASHLYAVGHDAVVLETRDAGLHWTLLNNQPEKETPLMDLLALDDQHLFAVGAYGLFMESTDGGANWQTRKILPEDRHLNAIRRLPDQRILVVGEAGTVLVSADQGSTFTALPVTYKGSWFGAEPQADGRTLIFGMRGHLAELAAGGMTLKEVDSLTTASLFGARTLADGRVALAGQGGTVLLVPPAEGPLQLLQSPGQRMNTALLEIDHALIALGEKGYTRLPLP